MRISNLGVFTVRIGWRNQCLVKVQTDDGVVGWGESGLSWKESAVAGALDHFRSVIVGSDPMARGAIWQELYRAGYFEGDRTASAAISAVDMALHDVVGKALGVPVYQLLGGRHRERVPLFPTVGAFDPDTAVRDAMLLADDGWKVIRLMCMSPDEELGIYEPRQSIASSAACVRAVREQLPDEVVLGVDFHHRLTPAEAVSFAQALPRGALAFLEEPIRSQSAAAYATLRRSLDIPLAVGEEFTSKWEFDPFLNGGLIDFARLDVGNVGGLTEAMKISAAAETRYIDVMPHNPLGAICTAATAHLATAIPNLAWVEYRGLEGDTLTVEDETVIKSHHVREGTELRVAEVPGLGVEVNEEALLEPAQPTDFPRLRRVDGSYTNW